MKSITFLILAFLSTWLIVIAASLAGIDAASPWAVVVLSLSMAGPAFAALTCAFLFERDRLLEVLGLRFRPNLWWLLAWLAPIAIAGMAIAITAMLSNLPITDPGLAAIEAAARQNPTEAEQLSAIPNLGVLLVLAAVTIGAITNAILLTLTEEIGWRGYLHALWRPAGFWRASFAVGLVWGLWHAPAVYLFGHHYPGLGYAGVALLVIYCLLLSPLFTLIRDRGGSAWAAGLLHGGYNALAPIAAAALAHAAFPWNGMFGVGGFLALMLCLVALAVFAPKHASAP